MSQRFIIILLLIILAGILGFVFWKNEPHIDSTEKIHVVLYEGADATWDPQMKVLPFRPQEINGEIIGSPNALRLEWQKPEQTYNHFLITITDPASGYTRKESGEHDRVSLDVDGLAPDTEYVFAIQACLNPKCEQWFIAQDEYRGRTAVEPKNETAQ